MANDEPPQRRGIRPPDYIFEMNIGRTEDLMLQAYSWRDIYARLVDEGLTDSEETAKNWRREVMRRWSVEDAEQRPSRKDAWRGRLELLYRQLLEKAGDSKMSSTAAAILYGEAIKVAKIAIVMDGLTAPVKVEHSGKLDVQAMGPLEREKEINELLAKRAAATKGPAPKPAKAN